MMVSNATRFGTEKALELARHYRPDEWAPDAAAAVMVARDVVRPGDAILVKGSRSVGLELVAEALLGLEP